jgi:hypothetical protein
MGPTDRSRRHVLGGSPTMTGGPRAAESAPIGVDEVFDRARQARGEAYASPEDGGAGI